MTELASVGVLYTLWMSDRSTVSCAPECAPLVDRAMKLWADSRRDSWFTVQGPTGQEFSVLASAITSTSQSDAKCRVEATVLDKAIEDERKANRAAAGFIESE